MPKFRRARRTNPRTLAFTHLSEKYRERSRAVGAPDDLQTAIQGHPHVTALLKRTPGGIDAVLNALRAFDDPDAQAFISLYDSITKSDRKHLSLEEIAVAANLGSSRLLGLSVEALRAYGQSISQIILWAGIPDMVAESVRLGSSKKYGSVLDREMMFKAAAFLPIPKGSSVAVQVNNQLPEPKEEAPRRWDPENQLRGIQEAWGDVKSLPAAEHEALTPTLDSLQDRTTDVLDGD